jgi:predicted O-linked N-acetylglucosamine transferase (SPINDLY family)
LIIVFINNKTPLSEDVFKKLDELHESFEVVNLTKLISVTAKTLVYYEIDNINIKNSKITYPSNDNDFELLYNKIVENKLLQCKGYDIIYDCIEKMSYKNQQTMSKLLSMAVLCKRNVLSQSIVNINKEDYKILFDWFLLFKSANKQITTDGSEIDYTPLMKKIGCDFLQHVVDKDIYMNDKNIINSIVNVYDVFIKIIDTNVYNALISVTKYLSKYITYAQTKSMIQMLLPHVSRAPDIKSFISLVEIIYPDFTIEKLLELYPNDSGAVELFISLTCNFSATDNLKTNVFDKRFKIKQNLELLLANNNITTQGLDTIISLNTGNFFMSYHGVSSKDIFILKCKLIRKICPELNYSINTEFKNKKIQVCFISSFLTRQHSVYKDRHQVIKQMADNPLFDVYFLTIDELRHDIKPSFGNAKHLQINRNLVEAKTLLNSMKLDAIVYCEIGMDPFFYLLAFMKLAKIQINTWGHSDTSGIDTIDYFFSSKYYEQEYNDAQNNYSEKLILLNSLCTYYINPVTKYPNLPFKSRYYYGFNDNSVIYFCGQSLFKFNQTYYQYIINIMNNNDRAVLLMLNGDNKIDFIKNINHDIINRIHWFNGMSHPDYLNLMNISNVVLDTYPFGGCNSSLEAFALGKVVVTQPSPMINGRFTKGFYDKMKLSHYVTNSMEEYIEFARKLIDSNYREMIENEIKNNRDVLFNDMETVEDWTHKIIELLN